MPADLAMHLCGRWGYCYAIASMFMFAYGAMVAYLVVLGDTLPLVLQAIMGEQVIINRPGLIILISISTGT